MEVSQGTDYHFYQVSLYPPSHLRGIGREPLGTAELEIFGPRGRLNCRTREGLGLLVGVYPQVTFPVFLCKIFDQELTGIGCLSLNQSGCGVSRWDFAAVAPGGKGSGQTPVLYKLVIAAKQGLSPQDGAGSIILMEGVFTLSFEVRGSRIVGFKKEAKVRKKSRQINQKNPLFQRVEPFQPPIPNSVWWRISIQPDLGEGYWQTGFCPRQKPSRAVF